MKASGKLSTAAGVTLIAALLGSSAALADAPAAAQESSQESGVWQKHQYSFAFMGFTTTYSCDGLADKLKRLLLAAGARKDVKSQPGACASPFGRPDKFARADLTFYTLAPNADQAADAQAVAGTWRPVTFAARSPRELAVGDCELVEQFQTNVLPMFTIRNLDNHTTCVPHQESGSVINLKFESFAAPLSAAPQTSRSASNIPPQ
jgi:hypothetical protein